MMVKPLDLAERRASEAHSWQSLGALERSALARRPDLPLGRALELRANRRSNELSVFDGNLSTTAHTTRLADGLARGLLSASAIERWCTCPFHYFLERVLSVVRGSLMHDVLEQFMRELLAAGRPGHGESYTRGDHDRLDVIADAVFSELEVRGLTGYRLAWENEREAILRDLHTFLMKDEQYRRLRDVLPAHFEQGFGMRSEDSWPEIAIPLADGKVVRLRGAIDRIDVWPDREHPSRAEVMDYKTGSVETSELRDDPARAGKSVQLALYSLVVREHLRGLGATEPEVAAAYWQIVSRHRFARTEVPTGAALDARLRDVLDTVHAGITNGAFPQRPGDEQFRPDRLTWDNCSYCEYDRICPAARGLLAERKENDPAVAIHLGLQPS
jgi:RecB family exonuclease